MFGLASAKVSILQINIFIRFAIAIVYAIGACILGIRQGYTTYGNYHRIHAAVAPILMVGWIVFNAQIDTLDTLLVTYDHVDQPLLLVAKVPSRGYEVSVQLVGLATAQASSENRARDYISALLYRGQGLTIKLMPRTEVKAGAIIRAYVFPVADSKDISWKDEIGVGLIERGLAVRDLEATHS